MTCSAANDYLGSFFQKVSGASQQFSRRFRITPEDFRDVSGGFKAFDNFDVTKTTFKNRMRN